MQVSTCCGCCSLKSGTITLGLLNIIFIVGSILSVCFKLVEVESFDNPEYIREDSLYLFKSLVVGIIAYLLITLAFSVLLILGAVKRKDKFVFPFVCLGFASNVTSIAFAIGYFVFIFSIPNISMSAVFTSILAIGFSLAIQIYLWLVVYSFHQQLIDEKYGHSGIKDNGGIVYSAQPPYGNDV